MMVGMMVVMKVVTTVETTADLMAVGMVDSLAAKTGDYSVWLKVAALDCSMGNVKDRL